MEDISSVRQETERKNPGEWLVGQGWNETDWIPAIQSNRQAGIDHSTADPPEGLIERNSNDDPTGALREMAVNLVRQAVPTPDDNHLAQALEDGMSVLHRLGITGIHDIRLMSDSDGDKSFRTFEMLEPYLDADCGIPLIDMAELEAEIKKADHAGLSVMAFDGRIAHRLF